MKIYIVTCVLLLLLSFNSAIGADIYKFRAFETYVLVVGENTSSDDYPWMKTDILIVVNLEKNQIRIFSKVEQNIDLIDAHDTKRDKYGNTIISYVGVDDEGKKMNITLKIFKTTVAGHMATLILEYNDLHIAYRLKSNK